MGYYIRFKYPDDEDTVLFVDLYEPFRFIMLVKTLLINSYNVILGHQNEAGMDREITMCSELHVPAIIALLQSEDIIKKN